MPDRIALVAGARPNFMKVGPLWSALQANERFDVTLVHTGQHYDQLMSDVFFADLGLPPPHVALGVGSGSHARQTAEVMIAFEEVCLRDSFNLVIVVGDVNSTLACALVARKLGVPIAHVEAGLRSRDWTMPEETNRVLTDTMSDYLFTPSPDAGENLRQEGVDENRIHFVGNIMIDSLAQALARVAETEITAMRKLPPDFGLVTIHRPSNVDEPEQLLRILEVLSTLNIPLVFPVHPRTQKEIARLDRAAGVASRITMIDPVGYYEFITLMQGASFVITDSGGVQEETTYLGVPCLTLRQQTERPITVELGTNALATLDTLPLQVDEIMTGTWKKGKIPPLWDGKTATRIVDVLARGIHPTLN